MSFESSIVAPKVIVVDDEETNRIILSAWLQRFGFECRAATDGLDALLHLDREPCDIVIMDWHMPGMDGLELIRLLRSRPFKQPPYLVFTTGDPDPRILQEAFEAGADDFIRKPVEPVELMARLHAAKRILGLEKRIYDNAQSEVLASVQRGAIRELSEVVGTLAHDLRTPLATIRLAAEGMLAKLGDTPSPVLSLAKRMSRVSTSMAETLDEVVSAFVDEGPRLTGWGSFDLLSEINRCLEMLSSSLPNPAMVCVPERTVALNGSPGSFRRLILNLVSNAVRHSESESIRISIEPYPTDPDLVVVEVSDDGKGIPAELLQNLGEPLFLADLEHRERFFVKGTGLGLFICRRIVAEFEGRIIVSSGTDRGTRVRLFLRRNLSGPAPAGNLAPIELEVLK
jgi:two-component system, sensor histidine kinase and response regulator